MSKWIPTAPEIGRETLTVLAGLLLVALVLNQFPAMKQFISSQSITLRDANGNILY